MRHSLGIIAAAAIAFGAASLSPAAATLKLVPGAVDATNDAIVQVQNWENFHGDRHNAFRDDGWNDGWRHRRHHRFRHSRYHRNHDFFGFPFAFRPRFYPYNSNRDCFRAWVGSLVCRGY